MSLSWARPTGATYWCAVVAVADSVVTACRGRWPSSDAYDTHANPRVEHRCQGCVRANLQQALITFRDAQAEVGQRVRDALAAADAAASTLIAATIDEALAGDFAITSAFPDEADWLDADGSTR